MACLDENQVLALAHGRLSGEALLLAQEHLDGCVDCLDLVGFYQQSAQDPEQEVETYDHDFVPLSESEEIDLKAPEGSKIGRYEVIRALGRGGMGVVYLARDPKLDRRVALKLVKPSLSADERAGHFEKRLMREARAMAKLAHPNVLTIYDVGIQEGQVFLASEWVDGCTLDEWMAQGPHRWPSIAKRFREAASGLVAAHAAGLIHRDFKPSNVMVGKDERVRVFDFGLVKATNANIGEITTQLSGNFVVGTPAYMAPEQMVGKAADERSDQFSFCASMYEALAGVRPFSGRNLTEILTNIGSEKVEEPKKIPKWLWDLIRRGLKKKPEDRHESMASILKILDARLGHRRRRSVIAGAMVVAVGVGAVGAVGLVRDQLAGGEQCSDPMLTFGEAWSAERRASLEAVATASELPFANASWTSAAGLFDAYAEQWQAQVHSACVETKIKRTESNVILERRRDCYERLQSEFASVTMELSQARPGGMSAIVALAQGLSPVEQCGSARVQDEFPSLADATEKDGVRKLWPQVKELDSLVLLGEYQQVLSNSEILVAEKLANRSLEARLWHSRATAERLLGNYQESVNSLESAFYAAVAGRSDEFAARVTTQIFTTLVVHLHDEERANRWHQLAQSAVERVNSPLSLGRWRRAEGKVAMAKRDFAAAERHFQDSLQIFESGLGTEHTEVARTLGALGRCQAKQGKMEDALATHQRAVEIWSSFVGLLHPDTATAEIDLAAVLAAQGKSAEAKIMVEKSVRAMVVSLGEENLRVAWALNSLAALRVAEGDYEGASSSLLRALQVKRTTHGNSHPLLVSTLTNLMEVDRMLGRFGDAAIHGNEALKILASSKSLMHREALRNLKLGVAEARLASGDGEGALEACAELQTQITAAAEVNATRAGRVLTCLAGAKILLGKKKEGQKLLDEAIVRFGSDGTRHRLAVALFAQAKLKVESRSLREEARLQAQQAQRYFSEAGRSWARESQVVQAWLSAQTQP